MRYPFASLRGGQFLLVLPALFFRFFIAQSGRRYSINSLETVLTFTEPGFVQFQCAVRVLTHCCLSVNPNAKAEQGLPQFLATSTTGRGCPQSYATGAPVRSCLASSNVRRPRHQCAGRERGPKAQAGTRRSVFGQSLIDPHLPDPFFTDSTRGNHVHTRS